MKETRKRNFAILVHPRALGNLGAIRTSDSMVGSNVEMDYKERCEEISEQIRRHVDNVGSVEMTWEESEHCSHCGFEWEVDETGMPLCCDKAQSEFNEAPITGADIMYSMMGTKAREKNGN